MTTAEPVQILSLARPHDQRRLRMLDGVRAAALDGEGWSSAWQNPDRGQT
jgi:hypothetical protein